MRKGIFIYRTLNLGVEFRDIINTSVGRLRKRDGYETGYEKNWNSEENEVFRTHRMNEVNEVIRDEGCGKGNWICSNITSFDIEPFEKFHILNLPEVNQNCLY